MGLTAGCKWCLCAGRWKEALLHARRQGNGARKGIVPEVDLGATHEKALGVVRLEELREFAVD